MKPYAIVRRDDERKGTIIVLGTNHYTIDNLYHIVLSNGDDDTLYHGAKTRATAETQIELQWGNWATFELVDTEELNG